MAQAECCRDELATRDNRKHESMVTHANCAPRRLRLGRSQILGLCRYYGSASQPRWWLSSGESSRDFDQAGFVAAFQDTEVVQGMRMGMTSLT
jgi:hypothetical protein